MPFPGNVDRVVFSGVMGGGEKWSSGFYKTTQSPGSNAQAIADAIAGSPSIAQLNAAHRAMNNSGTTLDRVTVYTYGSGRAATGVGTAALNDNSGTWSTIVHPSSVAACIILRTANSGRTGRGRMFWPATGVPMGTNNLMQTSTVQQLLNAVRFQLTQSQAVVVSEKLGQAQAVTRVTTDTRPDTIRARYDALVGVALVGS